MDRAEKFWDNRASDFNSSSEDDAPDPIYTRKLEITKNYLVPDDVVLDYACATGYITLDLAGHARELHGIDISSKMIEAAKRRAETSGIENVQFTHAKISDERYQQESFDAILAFNILHLVESPSEVVQRINALLKPGGVFISATPSVNSKMSFAGIFFVLLSKIGIVPNLNFASVSELEGLVTDSDFQIVESELVKGAMGHHFIVAKKS
ncbi:MAG: class I SAM-dependent methyltransferase [Chloroflexi bacterium]|nr:MAG: class I SAM-dependent methyltransferase [Chloroflexota bacterium]MBL1195336.1 class I SAM-dependent methyltransferase [Chloroflexota bacterium]NOH12620.1 class I SAM-dependent methyltransferase [Chloroflexota bacterium]